MKISKITYSALANLGNYENQRIELEATVSEDENWEEVLEKITLMVHQKLKNEDDYRNYCQKYDKAKTRLNDICEKLELAYEQWEETSNFLVAQGLKPSVPAFPIPKQNLITGGIEEIDAEIDQIPY
jgi:hypothetical protein